MQLAEVKGTRAMDVLEQIIVPATNLSKDEDVAKLFKRIKIQKDEKPRDVLLDKLRAGIPALMAKHRDDLIFIIATINDISKEEYIKDMTVNTLLKDVFELIADDVFATFF